MKKLIAAASAALILLSGCNIGDKTFVTTQATEDVTEQYPEAPNFIGKTVEQVEALRDRCPYEITIEMKYDSAEKGTVIDQSLTPGEKYSEDEELIVYASAGLKPVEVDNYTGWNIEEARALIKKQGFLCEVVRSESETIPENCIISTKPAAREMAEPGATIVCYVSMGSGKTEMIMPDLVGKTIEEAAEEAAQIGFGLNITYENDPEVEPGTVLSQDTEVGEVLQPDVRVDVVVAGESSSMMRKTTLSISQTSSRVGEFQLKYYIDGTLQEEKTEIKELSLTRKISWEVSGSEVKTYSILATSLTTGKSAYLFKIEVDFTQDPPVQNHEEEFNPNIFEELLMPD